MIESTTATPTLPYSGADLSAQGSGSRERIHRVAAMLHKAIDSVEQNIGSGQGGVSAAQGKYGQQARAYGDQLRGQVDARPLQATGIAFAVGIVLDKLLSSPSRSKVRVVKVPVPVAAPTRASSWNAEPQVERRANRWMQAAGAHAQNLKWSGREAAGKVGATAGVGLAGTKALASSVSSAASTLPLQMRLASQRLLARSQLYGNMARTGVQAHPMVGLGALAGVGALIATPLLRSRFASRDTAYVTVDDKGNGVAWQHDRPKFQTRAVDLVTERPVASAAVLLGLGALVGAALLKRR